MLKVDIIEKSSYTGRIEYLKYKNLTNFQDEFWNQTSLKNPCMWKWKALEESFNGMKNLKVLDNWNSYNIGNWRCQKGEDTWHVWRTYIWRNVGLRKVSKEIGKFGCIEKIKFDYYEKLKKLMKGFESLTYLKKLHMKKCEALKCVEHWTTFKKGLKAWYIWRS